jgi:zinc protease
MIKYMHSLPSPEDIVIHDLQNGIRLLMRQNHYAESTTSLGYLTTGGICDPDDKLGLANFTAAALMTGTAHHDFNALYDSIESLGASLHFSSGTNITNFSCQSLAEDMPAMLGLVSEILLSPTFPHKQFKRLKAQVMTGLALRAQDTAEMASLEFDKLIYSNHPYARPDEGYVDTNLAIEIPDLVKFHQEQYGPNGMVICVVGAIDPQRVISQAESIFGNWSNPNQKTPMVIPGLDKQTKPSRKHVAIPGKSQTDIVMGTIGPSRNSIDYLPCAIGNYILGQLGIMGRIGETVREKQGLAYYAQSNLNSGQGPGAWEFTAGVNPSKLDKAIELIKKEIKYYLKEVVTKAELNDTKSYLIGSLPLSLESNLGVAISLLNMQRFDLGFDHLQNYAAKVNAVTAEHILDVSRKYLSVEGLAVASAGKTLK